MSRKYKAALGVVLALCGASAGQAQTLAEAIDMAVRRHPSLQAERAALAATEEGRAQARAGYGPTANISLRAQADRARVDEENILGRRSTSSNQASTYSGALTINQPLYQGGRVRAAVSAAEADILAARQQLRRAENDLVAQVAVIYFTVGADQRLLRIADRNVEILEGELVEVRARFAARQVTRTDVAQAEMRLAASQAERRQARGRLEIDRAQFLALVGDAPEAIEVDPALPALPETLEAAFDIGARNAPAALAAELAVRAAEARVTEAKAAYRPTIGLSLEVGAQPLRAYDDDLYQREAQASLTVSQPLFTSGLNASRVRQAQAVAEQRTQQAEAARIQVTMSVSQAWARWQTARDVGAVRRSQLHASEQAYNGVKREQEFGLRTVIEVLNAEQERQGAEAAVVQAKLEERSAEAALLSALGLAEADLVLSGNGGRR